MKNYLYTALALCFAFINASMAEINWQEIARECSKGNLDTVKSVISQAQEDPSASLSFCLNRAASHSHTDIVNYLLNEYKPLREDWKPVDPTHPTNYALFAATCYSHSRAIVKLLLDYEPPNPNMKYVESNGLEDLRMICAARHGDAVMVKMLLDHAPYPLPDPNYFKVLNLLEDAVKNGRIPVLKTLLNYMPKNPNSTTIDLTAYDHGWLKDSVPFLPNDQSIVLTFLSSRHYNFTWPTEKKYESEPDGMVPVDGRFNLDKLLENTVSSNLIAWNVTMKVLFEDDFVNFIRKSVGLQPMAEDEEPRPNTIDSFILDQIKIGVSKLELKFDKRLRRYHLHTKNKKREHVDLFGRDIGPFVKKYEKELISDIQLMVRQKLFEIGFSYQANPTPTIGSEPDFDFTSGGFER